MHLSCNHLEVRRLRPDEPDFIFALGLALRDGEAREVEPENAAKTLLADARKRRLRVEPVVGAFSGGTLVCAAAAMESPGRTALVFLSPFDPQRCGASVADAAVQSVVSSLWKRGILLSEMLLEPGPSIRSAAANRVGFGRLTRLEYLARRPTRSGLETPSPCQGEGWGEGRIRTNHPSPDLSPRGERGFETQPGTGCMGPEWPKLRWTGYSTASHTLFAEAIQRSYAQSLDCPELTRLRMIEDVIAGHQAAGEFDPSLWWVASRNEQPVGVLLLTRVAHSAAMEIVYMGVVAESRGTGIGDALLTRAVGVAPTTDSAITMSRPLGLVLAVDERNAPARKLYARWGFEAIGARDAWIATPPAIGG